MPEPRVVIPPNRPVCGNEAPRTGGLLSFGIEVRHPFPGVPLIPKGIPVPAGRVGGLAQVLDSVLVTMKRSPAVERGPDSAQSAQADW